MQHATFALPQQKKRFNDQIDGLGNYGVDELAIAKSSVDGFDISPVLPGGMSQVVLFPLIGSGLFNQEKCLPLRFLQGLQIELEVVNQYSDCFLTAPNTPGPNPAALDAEYTAAVAGLGGASDKWSISEAQIKCSIIELDSQLDNEYTDHLMSGKNIPFPLSSFVHQVQSIGETDRPTLSMSRAFTRLNKVFITFYKVPYIWRRELDGAGTAITTNAGIKTNCLATHKPLRELNYFWHPNHIYDFGTAAGKNAEQPDAAASEPFATQQGRVYLGPQSEVELQLQIGSKVIPVLPTRSLAEQFYQLRQAIMGSNNSLTQLNISAADYRTFKYINCFDLQKVPGAFSSGLSTRTGDLITIKVLNLQHPPMPNGSVWLNSYGDFLHATFHHDLVMSVTDSGVTI